MSDDREQEQQEGLGRAFTPQDVLRYCALPRTKSIYLLGAGNRRVTIKSQQVRALNLMWALDATERLPKERVAIVGAGFAGLTAAAAALRLGTQVTIFENEKVCLHLQLRCPHRRVHPNLFDWPEPGSLTKSAGLPLLNWNAGSAGDAAKEVWTGWTREFQARASLRMGCRVTAINDDGTIEFVNKDPSAAAKVGSERFDVIIVAIGVGDDAHGTSPSYWQLDNLERYQRTGDQERCHVVIVGTGDGGITDALRATLGAYRDNDTPLLEWIEDELLPRVPSSLKTDLRDLERQLHMYDDPKKASEFLQQQYSMLLRGGLEELQKVVLPRFRPDTLVRLIAKDPTPYYIGATALNRFVLAVLRRFDPEQRQLRYEKGDGDQLPPNDDEVRIFRSGPKGAPDGLITDFRQRIAEVPKNYDAPRIPQYPATYFEQRALPRSIDVPENVARLYVPVTREERDKFKASERLDPTMRRRGPFGYGHYACQTKAEAKTLGAELLSNGSAVTPEVIAVALPNDSSRHVDWEEIPKGRATPEHDYEFWLRGKIRPDAISGVLDIDGDQIKALCFLDEVVGSPVSEERDE